MKFNLSTDHIEVGDMDLKLIEDKVRRLDKMLVAPVLIDVRLSHDKHHRQGDVITCRLKVRQKGKAFHAERASNTVQNAVDQTLAAMKKELQKYRDKRKQGLGNN